MLRLIDLALARGVRALYRGVSLTAPPGERIGLWVRTARGKSTLFAAILGELALDDGGRSRRRRLSRIAHVAQDIAADRPELRSTMCSAATRR